MANKQLHYLDWKRQVLVLWRQRCIEIFSKYRYDAT